MYVILISHLGRCSLDQLNLDLRGLCHVKGQYHHHQHIARTHDVND